MCSNTLPYWCCCLLSNIHASIETIDAVHYPKFYTILFPKCYITTKWRDIPNSIHEMQIALGNVGNKSHSRPHQCIWFSRHAQKWYQNWYYRSTVSFQLKFTKLSLWIQSSFMHTIWHTAPRYYNSQMAKYKVSSHILIVRRDRHNTCLACWGQETSVISSKSMRKIDADVAHSLSHLSNGKFMDLHSPNLII
jgi:hypothetical protein